VGQQPQGLASSAERGICTTFIQASHYFHTAASALDGRLTFERMEIHPILWGKPTLPYMNFILCQFL
jgi:hypothetical protein